MSNIIERLLTFFAKHHLRQLKPKKVVAITGSIGKTSTTQAIAHVLRESGFVVRSTRHNYNTNIGVASSVLALDLPKNAKNPLSWVVFFAKALAKNMKVERCDYVVLEFGTDQPGDIAQFSWVSPDISVVTAVAPEHMEFFGTLDAVAKEELSVDEYSGVVAVNRRMVADKFLSLVTNPELYQYGPTLLQENDIKKSDVQVIGEHSLDALAAALWIAKHEEIPADSYKKALSTYQSPSGRMRKFEGKRGSTIIDDTYNSSPEAAIAALQYLYTVSADARIALLGNMNELGDTSEAMHRKLGEYCNKTKLDLVVTLGVDANKYTAQAAKRNGCRVEQAKTPQEAADIIAGHLETFDKTDSVIVLCKGSQNGVYAEEAVKQLLLNSEDADHLVRQSKRWQKIKGPYWTER